MLKKTIRMLKNNPMLIIMPVLGILISGATMLFMIPSVKNILAISGNTGAGSLPPVEYQQGLQMLSSMLIFYLVLFVLGILGIVFLAGYGNMLAAAVNDGKASLKVFLFGIRRFFGKTFLSALLFTGITIGFSFAISIIAMPVMLAGVIRGGMENSLSMQGMMNRQTAFQVVTLILSAFLYPFIEMWVPSIFLNRNDGVTACFRKGLRAGKRKYLTLLVVTAVMVLPMLLLNLFSGNVYKMLESPLYYLSFVYQAIVSPVIVAYLFLLYKEERG